MTTITLNDDLMNQVVQIGHYQNPQEAVIAILSDYIQTHLTKETLFNNIDFSDENKPTPKIIKGDKTLNPTDLFGAWQDQPRNLNTIRKQAWQRSGLEK
jgi:hypothetical protein